ncbi:hypothetical protein ACFTXM_31375 [Streptomyces sp. NPDC056930]|uniref:hypothetical protein n=1 Tax=Streptomyces sp. NPDC056930 TaxID=3345967 RepID=UPI0036401D94
MWVPWAGSADGNAHVIDLRPGRECGRLGWAGHSGGDSSDAWSGLAAYLHEISRALYDGGGVSEMYPYLTWDGQLWWELGENCQFLNGDPLIPAPMGLG